IMAMPPITEAPKGLVFYGIQLLLYFLWPILFFNLQRFGLAFACLLLLWVFILATLIQFGKVSKLAAYLLIPYLVWVTFAGYLNLGIALLN
ncbi:MAG: tryptophan-rich sensory protein, partial [Clostridia bacterium]|nr:tryptophan-rich sensory protein [Clostridia bacterium]